MMMIRSFSATWFTVVTATALSFDKFYEIIAEKKVYLPM
jgi:hypothetical protein